jgi:6-phosphogluconolactonase
MAIHYMKVPSTKGAHALIQALQSAIDSKKKTVWLLSGGTNISIESFVASQLSLIGDALTAVMIDERFGPPGHQDSNYQKLVQADFPVEKFKLAPILVEGKSIEEAAAAHAAHVAAVFKEAEVIVAQLGLGADGHTAGVLPHSPAVESTQLVEHYQGPDFLRITLTLEALKKVHDAYVFAYGDDKHAAIRTLYEHEVGLAEQPSQILKLIPSVYIYNDCLEGAA